MDKQAHIVRTAVVGWIDRVLRRQKWTGTELARQAGIAPSTVLRLMNDPTHEFVPSMRTLSRLAAVSGGPIPREVLNALESKGVELTKRQSRSVRESDGEGRTVKLEHFSSMPLPLRGAPPLAAARVRVPDQLRSDPTLIAFKMFNDDLYPAIKSSALLFASKSRDPVKGDVLLISSRGGRSKVRFLFDLNENGFALSRSLPMNEEEQIAFEEVEELAIVVAMVSA